MEISATETRLVELERRIAKLEEQAPEDRVTLVVFSQELDRVLAAFIIATGAAAMGQSVVMFFTFWGYGALRQKKLLKGKSIAEAMLTLMSPCGSSHLPLSHLHFFGAGSRLLRGMMRKKNIASLEDLIDQARELGVRLIACDMTRDLMAIQDAELVHGVEVGGVATFVGESLKARLTLFI